MIFTIFLKISLSIVKSKETAFKEIFVTAFACVLLGWIPCIGCLLSGAIINARHETGFLAGIIVYILAILIGYIIVFFVAIAIMSFAFGINVVLPSI